MHVYVYDDYINKKKHENVLANIETRITDLGLNGKIIRLGVMKNVATAIEGEIKRGAKTIVAVGSDKTVSKIINAMIGAKSSDPTGGNIPLGIIPIDQKDNAIAQSLGIKSPDEACDTLSARRIEKLDVGQAMRVNAQRKISVKN